MSTCLDMVTDLRDRLDDASDAKVPEATKIRFLNRGQAAMFPRIYQIDTDITIPLVADTYEYSLSGIGVSPSDHIIGIEVADSYARYWPVPTYRLAPGAAGPVLVISSAGLPANAAALLRITFAKPLTAFATTASTYTGPAVTEELPVLYAMGLSVSRLLEQRMVLRRMPTVEGANRVDAGVQMDAADFWMAQFERILERLAMPLPAGF